ncbi:hypothetical protein BS78_02G149800 [Paspalum vaginatum]|nr:hypothetical protein BS78_02G149800 [Paspalum vaginatum]
MGPPCGVLEQDVGKHNKHPPLLFTDLFYLLCMLFETEYGSHFTYELCGRSSYGHHRFIRGMTFIGFVVEQERRMLIEQVGNVCRVTPLFSLSCFVEKLMPKITRVVHKLHYSLITYSYLLI